MFFQPLIQNPCPLPKWVTLLSITTPILKEKYDDHPKRTRDLEGRFPSTHALHRKKELEEELRLMYVASTRAKKNLFFTYPVQVYDRSS
ncbi:MAG: hypothetical protein JRI37_10420, partial [Deltaproteobacteria bacterium]|nr:hypothetical protein [Deltaproteobacteria bacterium]